MSQLTPVFTCSPSSSGYCWVQLPRRSRTACRWTLILSTAWGALLPPTGWETDPTTIGRKIYLDFSASKLTELRFSREVPACTKWRIYCSFCSSFARWTSKRGQEYVALIVTDTLVQCNWRNPNVHKENGACPWEEILSRLPPTVTEADQRKWRHIHICAVLPVNGSVIIYSPTGCVHHGRGADWFVRRPRKALPAGHRTWREPQQTDLRPRVPRHATGSLGQHRLPQGAEGEARTHAATCHTCRWQATRVPAWPGGAVKNQEAIHCCVFGCVSRLIV